MFNINYRKIVSFMLLATMSMVTGLSVGKIYVSTLEPPSIVSASEDELRDSKEDVLALYNRSLKEKISNFSAIELFNIAEYNLMHAENFCKIMTGEVRAPMGITQPMRSIKHKLGNVFTYDKFSPSTNSMAPEICSRIRFDWSTYETTGIKVNPKGSITSPTGKIQGSFEESGFQDYDLAKYKETFNTVPTSVLSYIVSSKICTGNAVSPITNNGDGTYSFNIVMEDAVLTMAALYYSYEIKFSSNLPKVPKWVSLNMGVTIDSDFNFKKITYKETYKMYVPAIGYAPVTDIFEDNFIFGEVPPLEEV